MTITFPHMGDAYLYARILCHDLSIPCIVPAKNNRQVLEKGVQYAPEDMCLPFKYMIANLIDAHERGADTVIMPATLGPCRLGEYGELFKAILDKHGYTYHWIIIDSPKDIGMKELLRRLSQVISGRTVGMHYVPQVLFRIYKALHMLEGLERTAYAMGGYEIIQGSFRKLLHACKNELMQADGSKEALRILKKYQVLMKKTAVDKNKRPLKVILTGEIYSLIEPCATHDICDRLMKLGISFEKRVSIGWWLRNIVLNPFHNAKSPYMPYSIGGYAKETVEEGVLCRKRGFDGLIQVLPSGCMPEIVAKSVFTQMAEEMDLKVLTILFDEMSGEAGYITRIEAFVDMLDRRRKHVLLGS